MTNKLSIQLPNVDGGLKTMQFAEPLTEQYTVTDSGQWNRQVFAAAHVVCDPLADNDPWLNTKVDWDKTLAFRQHLWSLGLGVAESMDTAQRGMGLDWSTSLELIKRSVAMAKTDNHKIACGAGTDHLNVDEVTSLDEVIKAYEYQCEAVEATGGQVILMASRALAKIAKGPEDYYKVYSHILQGLSRPPVLHWLGEMFDPALVGYWGSEDHDEAMTYCLAVINDNADKIDGIKISLLSKEKEVRMRRQLPEGVLMYTGDDFNYPELIKGDEQGYSHALLGIFDPIATSAAAAMSALGAKKIDEYEQIFTPTVPLSRHIFKTPTRFYKTGVVFMAYLNGHQDHFTMVGGQESTRSTLHLAEIVRLANEANLFTNPEAVIQRAAAVFSARGVNIQAIASK